MLFIGDLHLKNDMKDEIFKKLQNILENTKETNIIFLWDFVYHFSHKPKIIWEFFDLLLKYQENKKIFILAWNHDYIKWDFIFSQAEKLSNLTNIKNLKIISSPQTQKINWKKILFFPFYTRIAKEEEFSNIDKKIKLLESWTYKNLLVNLFFVAYTTWKNEDKNMQISWTINLDLVKYLLNEKFDMIIHHFYTENTLFPWQFSKFSFKNIALSKEIFNFKWEIISGHLHKSFKHKNYTCVWSFWNSSPLEENDTKIIFEYPNIFKQVIINPYLSFEVKNQDVITKQFLEKKRKEIEEEAENLLKNKIEKDNFTTKKVSLTLKSKEEIDFDNVLEKDLLENIQNISYRNINKKSIQNILNELEINQEKLSTSFNSWKELAQNYISKKYPNEKESYLEILKDLDLIN